MHSWTFRLNAIFTFTVTVLAVLSALNALSVAFLNPEPIATIDNVKLQRLPGSGYLAHALPAPSISPFCPPSVSTRPHCTLHSFCGFCLSSESSEMPAIQSGDTCGPGGTLILHHRLSGELIAGGRRISLQAFSHKLNKAARKRLAWVASMWRLGCLVASPTHARTAWRSGVAQFDSAQLLYSMAATTN